MVCAQIVGGIDDAVIDLGEYVVDRQYHERQEIVYHAEDDCAAWRAGEGWTGTAYDD